MKGRLLPFQIQHIKYKKKKKTLNKFNSNFQPPASQFSSFQLKKHGITHLKKTTFIKKLSYLKKHSNIIPLCHYYLEFYC